MGKDQMEADAEMRALNRISELRFDPGLADHGGGAGNDPTPVCFKDPPGHAWGAAKVIRIDDQSPSHLLPRIWMTYAQAPHPAFGCMPSEF
jgi:hypothetical protein